jgi:Flp pilus assembly protein TadB
MNSKTAAGIGEIVLHETLIFGTVFFVFAVILMNIWAGLFLVTAAVSTVWVLKCRGAGSINRKEDEAAGSAS